MSSAQPKVARSRLARKTLAKIIPEVLQSSSCAKSGIEHVKLLRENDLKTLTPLETNTSPPKIRVVAEDTLHAAFEIVSRRKAGSAGGRIAVLSMASELRPGGGFLNGASSQEESLCMRTTLYRSLHDEFYRLPELGCIYTPDVCVFRGRYSHHEGVDTQAPDDMNMEVNAAREWWFIDVISCAAIRGPDVDEADDYTNAKDRDLMREKIKRIFRAAALNGCRSLVLGAFGCGAFGNPPGQVARLFHRILMGRDGSGTGTRGGEFVGCFDEVVFAIKGGKKETLAEFQAAFQATSDPAFVIPKPITSLPSDT